MFRSWSILATAQRAGLLARLGAVTEVVGLPVVVVEEQLRGWL